MGVVTVISRCTYGERDAGGVGRVQRVLHIRHILYNHPIRGRTNRGGGRLKTTKLQLTEDKVDNYI